MHSELQSIDVLYGMSRNPNHVQEYKQPTAVSRRKMVPCFQPKKLDWCIKGQMSPKRYSTGISGRIIFKHLRGLSGQDGGIELRRNGMSEHHVSVCQSVSKTAHLFSHVSLFPYPSIFGPEYFWSERSLRT